MKITRRELDSSILEKLDQFDSVVSSFDENCPDCFVSYGQDGFYLKKTNDTFLRKVYDENEIINLEKSLYSKDSNVRSSMMTDMRIGNKKNMAAMTFLYNLEFSEREQIPEKIVKRKVFPDMEIILDRNGVLYFNEERTPIKFTETVSNNFNISKGISAGDVCDFEVLDGNTILVATVDNGIYKVKLDSKEIELLIVVERVRAISISHTGSLFVFSDKMNLLVDVETGNIIEKFYDLYVKNQIPFNVIKIETGFLVIGKPVGNYITDSLVHYYKLDKAQLSYNSVRLPEKHRMDSNYQILFSGIYEGKLYLSGKYNYKNCFVWCFDISDNFSFSEELFDCVDLESYDGFLEANGYYIFLSGNDLFVVKENELFSHYELPNNCKGLSLEDGEITSISGSYVVKFSLYSFEKKYDNLEYLIYESNESCNNIDIFIKGATRNERITLFDEETGKIIQPSYYMIYGKNSIIKLMNCKSKKIKMSISVNENSFLGGIVVRTNNMFLR